MFQELLDSLRLFKNNYTGITLIILPIFIPVEVFDVLYSKYFLSENSGYIESFPPFLVALLAYPIYSVGVIFFIASVVEGKTIDSKTSWRLGIKYWAPFFLLTLFISVLVVLGLLLLIIPGVILIARFAFAEFELLLNQRLPFDSMRESWEATRTYVWMLLGGFLVITIVLYGPFFGLMAISEQNEVEIGVLDNVLNIVYAVLSTLYTIFAFRIYKLQKEQHNKGLNMAPESGGS